MKFSVYLLEVNEKMTLDSIINKINDRKLKKSIQEISSLLLVKKSSGKSAEIVFQKNEIDKIKQFAKANNLNITKDSQNHDVIRLKIGEISLKIRSTGASLFKSADNSNLLGKKLADASELATILSLTKEIKTPEDTEQQFFIENPRIFKSWENTFKLTRKAVLQIVSNIQSYEIIHDATDKSNFNKIIKKIISKGKPYITSKDAWCPADIFLIKKSARAEVVNILDDIVDTFESKDMILQVNSAILELYNQKKLIPISLKQITSTHPKIQLNNDKDTVIPTYNIVPARFKCDLTANTKEIGSFTFLNEDTMNEVKLQFRGFPFGYTIAQMEIVSDGSKTGGRLGKVPTGIVDSCLNDYNDYRIKSIDFFGKIKNNTFFGSFDDAKIKEVYGWFKDVKKSRYVNIVKDFSFDEFNEMIEMARTNGDLAASLAIKIQGLKILRFFVNNIQDTSAILTKLLNGAQKINTYSAFFIKIY